jgi:pimeloyl-ACP methyl ester carboxylesterase
MGGSRGSALAVHMLKADPARFAAYVGTAQIVRFADNENASYVRTLALARAASDADAVAKLEALGSPPWTNPRAFGILRRVTRKYEAARTDPLPAGSLQPGAGYDTPDYEAAYTAGEDYSFFKFVGPAGNGMAAGIDLPALGTRFPMPIHLIQGAEDLVTIPAIGRRYFDSIAAPDKTFTLLSRTGHDLNPTMLAAQLAMLRKVRRLALAGR